MFLSMKHALVSESDSALDKAAFQQLLYMVRSTHLCKSIVSTLSAQPS